MLNMRFTVDGVYAGLDGPPADECPEFAYLVPVVDDNGMFVTVDCWLVNAEGDVHPGYGCSPIPTPVEHIGGMVRHLSGEGY